MGQDMVYFNFGIPKGEKGDKGDTGPAPDMSDYPTWDDLEDYPTFDDVATQVKTGTIMGNANKGFQIDEYGRPYAVEYADSQYQGLSNDTFIGKGTLVNTIQTQIDAITASSDVVDIVGTYADLQSYDTSKLTDDDIIKVLSDSTHSNALSYFRWNVTNNVGSWVYVGSEGPFFTKSEIQATYATIAYVNDIVGDIESILEVLDIGTGIWGD